MFENEELNNLSIEFHNKMGKAHAISRTIDKWEIELFNLQISLSNDSPKQNLIKCLIEHITILKVDLICLKELIENQFDIFKKNIANKENKRIKLIDLDLIIDSFLDKQNSLIKNSVRLIALFSEN